MPEQRRKERKRGREIGGVEDGESFAKRARGVNYANNLQHS